MGDIHVTLDLDTEGFANAVRRATRTLDTFAASLEQAAKAAEAFAATMRSITEAFATPPGRRWSLATRRASYGGNGGDAHQWPEHWQSSVCAAWLHEACPSDTHHLDCTCTCHRKAR